MATPRLAYRVMGGAEESETNMCQQISLGLDSTRLVVDIFHSVSPHHPRQKDARLQTAGGPGQEEQ